MENLADTMMSSALAYQEEQQEVPQMPFWAKTLENIPAATAVAGNYGRRGANTIIRGPRGGIGSRTKMASRSPIRQAIMNNVRPFSRFRSQEHLTGTARSSAAKYHPFFASDMVNAIDRGMTGRARTGVGQSVGKIMPQRQISSAEPLMAGGMYSRVSAASKIGLMSDASFQRYLSSGRGGPGVGSMLHKMGMNASDVNRLMYAGDKGAIQRALLTQGGGRATGRIGGYLSAFTDGGALAMPDNKFAQQGFKVARGFADDIGIKGTQALTARNIGTATKGSILKATSKRQGAKMAGKGAALMAGRAAGLMIPGLNVAMTAWMAYDLAKLGTQLAGKAVETAGQSYTSFRGDIDTRVMGQTFKDSEAALTSRARGVQAIQNSRMNARSALGAEAGALASHFG